MVAVTTKRHGSGGMPSALKQVSGGLGPQVYLWINHTSWMVAIWVARLAGRFVSGRVMLTSRATDATWWHAARAVRGGFWASRAGWVRQLVRLSPLLAVLGWWLVSPTLTVLTGVLLAAAAVWGGWRSWQQAQHDKQWLEPLWPAIVRILNSEQVRDAPPRSWVEMPWDPSDVDAEIVVGLPEDVGDDAPRIVALRTLFDQRLPGSWVPQIESGERVVTFTHRPPDPVVWPAVAKVLDIDPHELSADWMDMPADLADPAAQVRVYLPQDLVDTDRRLEWLRELANQRFPGQWATSTNHQERVVLLKHKEPDPEPPTLVDAHDLPDLADLLADPEVDEGETSAVPEQREPEMTWVGASGAEEVVDAEFDPDVEFAQPAEFAAVAVPPDGLPLTRDN